MLNYRKNVVRAWKWNLKFSGMTKAAALSSTLLLGSCKQQSSSTQVLSNESAPASGQITCAAIRGNGPRIFAHFGALAKLVEDVNTPLISTIAGGSSVSITAFLYESMLLNKLIVEAPDLKEKRRRLAIMLKTLDSLPTVAANSPPAQALFNFQLVAEAFNKRGIPRSDQPIQIETLAEKLPSPSDVKATINSAAIINPKLITFATELALDNNTSRQAFRNLQVTEIIIQFGKFNAQSPYIVLRPGLFNFDIFAQWVGYLGGFYEGKENGKFWEDFFSPKGCSLEPRKSWPAAGTKNDTCRAPFETSLSTYIKPESKKRDRSEDRLGLGLNALIGVSFTRDDGSIKYYKARKNEYDSARPNTTSKTVVQDFSKVSFGYYGANPSLDNIEKAKAANANDENWKKVAVLRNATWREVLTHSPAEPGLDSAHLTGDASTGETLFFGGWSALFPVDIVKSQVGCEEGKGNVFFITRPVDVRDATPEFARKVAGLVGMKPEDDKKLFDPQNSDSGFRKNVRLADKVMCVNWDNNPKATASLDDFHQLFETGYKANIGLRGNPQSSCLIGAKD